MTGRREKKCLSGLSWRERLRRELTPSELKEIPKIIFRNSPISRQISRWTFIIYVICGVAYPIVVELAGQNLFATSYLSSTDPVGLVYSLCRNRSAPTYDSAHG